MVRSLTVVPKLLPTLAVALLFATEGCGGEGGLASLPPGNNPPDAPSGLSATSVAKSHVRLSWNLGGRQRLRDLSV